MQRQPARFWDFPAAVILTLILVTVSQRFSATGWAPGLAIGLFLAVPGALLGMALGASRLKPAGAFWIAFGYTIASIPLVAGVIFYHQVPWLERMLSLSGRLENAVALFASSQPVPDTVLFVIFAGVGFWLIGMLAGFALTDAGDFVLAVVPAGIVLFIIQVYDMGVGDSVIVLAIYAFLCLLLLGRLSYTRRRLFWKSHRVSFSSDSWNDINFAIPVAAVVLILIAWLTPATTQPVAAAKAAWANITHPLDTLRHDLSNAVTGLKGPPQGTVVYFYGDTLPLGLAAANGDAVYLNITVPPRATADRYYWRVRAYDQFLNNQWQNDSASAQDFSPGDPNLPLVDQHGITGEFSFSSPGVNLGVLITPAHPIWVSRPAVITYAPAPGRTVDPLMFTANPPIFAGELYVVHANIYNPTVNLLQQAGTDYPAWVTDHYLQLPGDLDARIGELAHSLTAQSATPYDKAIAITDYLRSNITYSLTVEAPPQGTDPLVWFLFDTRKGFCNYYATAEVIMLRSLGIPARMVVGFAQGEDVPPNSFTVREKDAHAWPEVYFPGIGWVEFEPTSSQPVLTRRLGTPASTQEPFNATQNAGQGGENLTPTPPPPGGPNAGVGYPQNPLRVLVFFGLLLIVVAGGAVAFATGLFDKLLKRTVLASHRPLPILVSGIYASLAIPAPDWLKRWVYSSGLTPIERSFGVVFQSLRRLGVHPSPALTPAEAAAALIAILPGAVNETASLLREYQNALFSRRHPNLVIAGRARKTIAQLTTSKVFRMRMDAIRGAFFHRLPRRAD